MSSREGPDDARGDPDGDGVVGDVVADDAARTLVGGVRASLCLETGDPDGAERALSTAYAAALKTGDRPMLALVAVHVAALAEAHGRYHEVAVLLGAACRLRGAHDRTDRQVQDLTRRGRAALGEETFATAQLCSVIILGDSQKLTSLMCHYGILWGDPSLAASASQQADCDFL